MIRFTLVCGKKHEFEGWFKSNAAFESQAEMHAVSCPICGDSEVKKALMAPAVARRREAPPPVPVPASAPPLPAAEQCPARMVQVIRAVQDYVQKNFDNVGMKFPEEARKIHYGEAEERGIYGQASKDDVRELLDEGIEIRPLPMLPEFDS